MRIRITSTKLEKETVEEIQKMTNKLVKMNCSAHAIMYYIVEEYGYSTCIKYENDVAVIKIF